MSKEYTCPVHGKPATFWSFESFEILSVTPCSGFLAVFIDEDGAPRSSPVHLLGVARRTLHNLFRCEGRCIDPCREEIHKQGNSVVALDLSDGYTEVLDGDDNYAGFCREGDDIAQVTGCLSAKYRHLREAWGERQDTAKLESNTQPE